MINQHTDNIDHLGKKIESLEINMMKLKNLNNVPGNKPESSQKLNI